MVADIVKRARSYEVGNLALQATWVKEMHELADEVERLRGLAVDLVKQNGALAREVERLQAALEDTTYPLGEINDLRAEIERLKGTVEEPK
jgi:uncharacterized small protein (DUF1192 family)